MQFSTPDHHTHLARVPVPARPRRLVGVWAHPDDEAYLSAGLMAQTVDDGGSVTVVVVTDGELGFADDDARTFGGRSLLRRAEMREAMAQVGVSDVRFLGVPDGFVARMDTEILVEPIARVLADVRPDLTVTFAPDGMTGHDDHIATGHATTCAWLDQGEGALLYATHSAEFLDRWRPLHDEVGVWMTGEPVGCAQIDLELVVALAGAGLDRKRRVLACHDSQTAEIARLMGEATYRHWVAEECFRKPTVDELGAAVVARDLGVPWETLAARRPVVV